jgi:hypothetical protein
MSQEYKELAADMITDMNNIALNKHSKSGAKSLHF